MKDGRQAKVAYPTEGEGGRAAGAGVQGRHMASGAALVVQRSLPRPHLPAPPPLLVCSAAGMGDDVAGRSFHHGRFVQKLRQAAAGQPSVTVRQGYVRRLLNGD